MARPRIFTKEEQSTIARLYEKGERIADIPKILGKGSYKSVRNALVRQEITLREKNTNQGRFGSSHPAFKTGRYVHQGGYMRVRLRPDDPMFCMATNQGLVMEHRLVMARVLGRPLRRGETVHHLNGDRLDNRPENLQLRQGNHGPGVVLCCADCGSVNLVEREV